MAESVDASVSNTDGAIRAGSTPAQGTQKIANSQAFRLLAIFHLPIPLLPNKPDNKATISSRPEKIKNPISFSPSEVLDYSPFFRLQKITIIIDLLSPRA